MKLVDEPKGLVILVFPKLQDPQWPLWSPLDIFAIASSLMHAGYEVCAIDDRVDPEARAKLARDLPGALFVGIGTKFGDQLRNALAIAQEIKAARPDVPIVMGGWFPSLFPDSVFESPHFDIAIVGPGDFCAPEVADRLLAGEGMEGVTGVYARENGAIVRNPKGHLPDIRKTVAIPWAKVGIRHFILQHGWINLFTSRGCPGECNFCAIYCLDPRRWTALPAERVVDDMEALQGLGARAFKVMDTDYCADVRRVEAISRLILERGLRVRYEVLGRQKNLRAMTDEQVRLLRKSGCTEIEMGVEAGSQRLSDLIRKNLQVNETAETVRRFVTYGIRIKANFMFGIPTETEEDLNETLDLMNELLDLGHDAVRFQMFRYTPVPGGDSAVDDVWKELSREDQQELSLKELADFPVTDMEPDRMFWIDESYEPVLRRVYYFYAPLALLIDVDKAFADKPLWARFLMLLRPLARWRIRRHFYRFPFEKWLNDRFGHPMPHATDDGIGPHEEVLPENRDHIETFMGDTFNPRPPLEPGVSGNGTLPGAPSPKRPKREGSRPLEGASSTPPGE
jgi:radical SAM superfamily enzyme YgiQ (UPF0313 family)